MERWIAKSLYETFIFDTIKKIDEILKIDDKQYKNITYIDEDQLYKLSILDREFSVNFRNFHLISINGNYDFERKFLYDIKIGPDYVRQYIKKLYNIDL